MASPQPPSSVSESDESRLCLSCGLCCSGTAYSAIPLEADELERAGTAGFTIRPDAEGAPEAAQPCPQLQGTACRLYGQWRPRACIDYACRLLVALRAGEIGADEALAKVARIKALIDERLPETEGRSLRELVAEAEALTRAGAITAQNAVLLVTIGAINREIDRVIRFPSQSTFR